MDFIGRACCKLFLNGPSFPTYSVIITYQLKVNLAFASNLLRWYFVFNQISHCCVITTRLSYKWLTLSELYIYTVWFIINPLWRYWTLSRVLYYIQFRTTFGLTENVNFLTGTPCTFLHVGILFFPSFNSETNDLYCTAISTDPKSNVMYHPRRVRWETILYFKIYPSNNFTVAKKTKASGKKIQTRKPVTLGSGTLWEFGSESAHLAVATTLSKIDITNIIGDVKLYSNYKCVSVQYIRFDFHFFTKRFQFILFTRKSEWKKRNLITNVSSF